MTYSVQSKKNGTTYYLHHLTKPTKSGTRILYFFSKKEQEGTLDALPEGYSVVENASTGLPLLKRKT